METLIAVISVLPIGVFVTSYFVQVALKEPKSSLLDVEQSQFRRNAGVLWILILISIVHAVLLQYVRTFTGITMLDGAIGVALGLYICADSAATAVNMLFFEGQIVPLGELPAIC